MAEKKLAVKNALESLAARLQVNPESLKTTLKATVCKGIKIKGTDKYRPITDEEFLAFVVVANAYQLNPLTKEIYAYPDTKSGAIIPVVSTDGWNKLMTKNPNYKNHGYSYSEETTTPTGGKECPNWIEVWIEKKDGTKVVVREYLDECFRELTYHNPWQTHTKRMLRHKAKIQGARETFGFAGIYDLDEAQRIANAGMMLEVEAAGKPPVQIPEKIEKKDEHPQIEQTPFKVCMEKAKIAKGALGDELYYNILGSWGFTHFNEIKTIERMNAVLKAMDNAAKE